jgi:uncharacterized UPF0160 family protein
MPDKKLKIVTHNGPFHVDDVFAISVLDLVLKVPYELIRTRDPEIISSADIVVDVGGAYDEEKGRFDHHQQNGAGQRGNKIPYSSIGLVWKKYGQKICDSNEISQDIDERLITSIDALDNGVSISENIYEDISPYTLHNIITSFRPAWNEKQDFDLGFQEAMICAQKILLRALVHAKAREEAKNVVLETYQKSDDKRILVFENYYPIGDVLNSYPEPLYIIHPDQQNNNWVIRCFRENDNTFESRKPFPSAWAGKRDSELESASGVTGAVFCHRARFIAIAQTKESAIHLAQKAVDDDNNGEST